MLKVGESIPDIETEDESGNSFRSTDLLGKKYVIYFYPKDNTPGCAAEARSIRDSYHVFEDAGIPIFGVSGGSVKSHRKFKEKYALNFPLLMDEDYSIAKLFRAYHPTKVLGRELLGVKRITYLVDEEGRVEAIFGGPEGKEKVNTKQHADQIVKHWGLKL
ncbi:MAG: peroxiredoxin [Candidatus Thorarchaeota archaeon]|nr:peroxiredoxin [Candidatus Thorarchaeota archaeon]